MIQDLGQSGRLALTFARLAAVELSTGAVGTEHLLLGVAELEDVTLRRRFEDLGVDLDAVCAAIRQEAASSPGDGDEPAGRLRFTPAAEQALETARQVAARLGGRLVEAPHVLIGVLRDERGLAARKIEAVHGGEGGGPLLPLLEAQLRQMLAEGGWSAGFYRERTAIEQPEVSKTSTVLASLGRDLTGSARRGELSPTIGRERELVELVHVLLGQRKHNAVLIGEAGVGKTAIVEGLAQRIVAGRVPEQLEGMEIRTIEVGSLVAGTQYRGMFEAKLEALIEEVRERSDVVLFVDELHMLVGAGRAEGIVMDAADMLKPALTEGTLKVIGATTTDDFRRHIERDKALMRRFQPIVVGEPSREDTVKILAGLRPRYERFHGVTIAAPALDAAVDLSVRHLGDRHLPDKALDLLDRACTQEKLGAGMRDWMPSLAPPAEGEEAERALDLVVDAGEVAEVVSLMLEIPIAALRPDELRRLRGMAEALKRRVAGQEEAVDEVANALLATHALEEPEAERPYGVFLFLGPRGVGKTRLAQELADYLYGDRDELIRLDMAEYGEQHAVSVLIGTAPGYAGWEDGGRLTNAVRAKPYSVLLVDAVEKSHPAVAELFLEVLREGGLTDRAGRRVDFRSTVIVMTSTAGAGGARPIGFGAEDDRGPEAPSGAEVVREAEAELRRLFGQELLDRIDRQVVFRPLSKDALRAIVSLLVEEMIPMRLELSDAALDFVVEQAYDPALGARAARRAIQRLLRNPLSLKLANEEIAEGDEIAVDLRDGVLVFTASPAGVS